jgi:hypothetical protein
VQLQGLGVKTYENKSHQETCALRFIPPGALQAARRSYAEGNGGEPVHCSCIKPVPSFVRFLRLTRKREEA